MAGIIAYGESHAPTFYALTQAAFHFLEDQYSYRLESTSTHDMQYWKDACARVDYVSEYVAVTVGWGFADAYISVTFAELHEPWVVPEHINVIGSDPTAARAFSLDTLVEMLGHSKDPDFFLHGRGMLGRRSIGECARLIETNMEGILEVLARATQRYAADILAGNTSRFPEVVRYCAKQMGMG